MLWGGELVLREGVASGQVTSAAWGETLGACVGLAYVWDAEGGAVDRDWVTRSSFEVDVNGSRWPVRVSFRALVDPDGERIKG
jgi:4-methylaminobutanoate oxidase (formaldehyde-forming)